MTDGITRTRCCLYCDGHGCEMCDGTGYKWRYIVSGDNGWSATGSGKRPSRETLDLLYGMAGRVAALPTHDQEQA